MELLVLENPVLESREREESSDVRSKQNLDAFKLWFVTRIPDTNKVRRVSFNLIYSVELFRNLYLSVAVRVLGLRLLK